ncbi:sorbitol dehydrogenase isoform X1 [Physcomitrium patens]|uniref:Enoyl reductase (ER) domain-containing protein n=1 Tax=Physcomitrium patens TaxID=3218 RepID=A9RYI0_PHYPA|nr:sorbitol dehydrogenase-like isoform X1 [Physcomitrium patens]XP_024395169.1 sorbitol dehydrogenase-like isoform X1 [Physcomitrium patens]XP_024395170.1 sorbitol dehydrogenase-like isoform X1 [Physcomitrium patens]XP_024395171.1 sorbitol dehydrogenase-like isoform X1 [Physcomitrium patens]XP_024395173.1 sorbitol dehydrogenase-like isoform X1 [Physcomitrium patens]XP_024395174.1 sorbitol dehydrogenase-like isoform X1 [Physcomitrium patens]XP_024395175.1 sorbitol dehydrogenase-like isoform X1|eukprot:XP_024395168.1 sorbitol dehydrogenase-like isoform X1 [Physcomitrella patens]
MVLLKQPEGNEASVLNGSGGQNMAAWVCGKNDLKVQPYNLPPVLGDHEVKVGIKAVGICGSDVHYYRHLQCGDFIVKEPMVIGHECAGTIEEVGKAVKNVAVGDRVALEPGIACNKCKLCKQGFYNLCPDMEFFATPPVHGSLANHVIHPADMCFKLPENVSLEEGAMCEPLSVGVHACQRATVGPTTKVLILGAGPIGLVTLLAAHAFGSPTVVIADISPERLKVAKELGANATVVLSTSDNEVESEVLALQKAMGADIDVTIDCVGFTKSMKTALKATRAGGRVCLVGMGHNEMTLPLTPAAAREVDILGVFRYRNTYPLCLDLISSGRVNVKPLITHRFGFNQKDVVDAFETSAKGGSSIKVMFNL